jgi:hypothetical protein
MMLLPDLQDQHCRRSVGAHYQEWAGSMSLSSGPIEAAGTVHMYKYDEVTLQLPE